MSFPNNRLQKRARWALDSQHVARFCGGRYVLMKLRISFSVIVLMILCAVLNACANINKEFKSPFELTISAIDGETPSNKKYKGGYTFLYPKPKTGGAALINEYYGLGIPGYDSFHLYIEGNEAELFLNAYVYEQEVLVKKVSLLDNIAFEQKIDLNIRHSETGIFTIEIKDKPPVVIQTKVYSRDGEWSGNSGRGSFKTKKNITNH